MKKILFMGIFLSILLYAMDISKNNEMMHWYNGYVRQKNNKNFRFTFYILPAFKGEPANVIFQILPDGDREYKELKVHEMSLNPCTVTTDIGRFILDDTVGVDKNKSQFISDDTIAIAFKCLHTQMHVPEEK